MTWVVSDQQLEDLRTLAKANVGVAKSQITLSAYLARVLFDELLAFRAWERSVKATSAAFERGAPECTDHQFGGVSICIKCGVCALDELEAFRAFEQSIKAASSTFARSVPS